MSTQMMAPRVTCPLFLSLYERVHNGLWSILACRPLPVLVRLSFLVRARAGAPQRRLQCRARRTRRTPPRPAATATALIPRQLRTRETRGTVPVLQDASGANAMEIHGCRFAVRGSISPCRHQSPSAAQTCNAGLTFVTSLFVCRNGGLKRCNVIINYQVDHNSKPHTCTRTNPIIRTHSIDPHRSSR